MATNALPPWASGPGEILKHGIDLLGEDSDTKRRLAMISIDNAVELTIKTYLGLPKRITGIHIPRKRYGEIFESFPALLDALEEFAEERLEGVDLGEVEWYHRLRNELYHQGNGLTVERDKVEVYAQLANVLFKNLFEVELVHPDNSAARLLGDFLEAWIEIERGLISMAHDNGLVGPKRVPMLRAAEFLLGTGMVSREDLAQLRDLQGLRNAIVHGTVEHRKVLTPEVLIKTRRFAKLYREEV